MTQEELDALMSSNVDLETLDTQDEQPASSGHEEKEYKQNHLVAQLGDVTADSEVKATEIFDKLELVLVQLDELQKNPETLQDNIDSIRNIIFETMSIMQYQDIHRQKIERVINTMRSISKVMDETLNSVTSDSFAPSARHIKGDKDTQDLVDESELEELIKQMGNQ